MVRTLIIAMALGASALTAAAETTASLDVLRKVEVVGEDGVATTEYRPVSTAVPGEILTYRIVLDNPDPDPAEAIGMTIPVDPNLRIDPFSITGPDGVATRFSVDGINFSSFEDLWVEKEGERVPAEAGDITHLKIALTEIPAKSIVSIEYSASVE